MKTKMWQSGLVVSAMVLAGLAAPALGQIYANPVGVDIGDEGDEQTVTIPPGGTVEVWFAEGYLGGDGAGADLVLTYTGKLQITIYNYSSSSVFQASNVTGGWAVTSAWTWDLAGGTATGLLLWNSTGSDVTLDAVRANYPVPNTVLAAVDDTVQTEAGVPITIGVLANDVDAAGDPLSVISIGAPDNGSVTLNADGTVTYTPNADFAGTDSFTYMIGDRVPPTVPTAVDTATVTVTTVVINQPPVAADDAAATEAGVSVTIDALGNDRDDDGDPLSVVSVGVATCGSTAANTDNTVTYTPNPGFVGTDEFLYTISDGNAEHTAKVIVAVSARNVLIDIKPGSYPNSINLGSNGVVPVAILSEADFDATTVNPDTVGLAGAAVAVRGKGNRLMTNIQDVDGDGSLDLVLQIETENLDPTQLQDGYGTIVGITYGGAPIIGSDEINIVPQ